MTSKGDPAYWGCDMHGAFLNGLNQRWADTVRPCCQRATLRPRQLTG